MTAGSAERWLCIHGTIGVMIVKALHAKLKGAKNGSMTSHDHRVNRFGLAVRR